MRLASLLCLALPALLDVPASAFAQGCPDKNTPDALVATANQQGT